MESKEAPKWVVSKCQSYHNIKMDQLVEDKIPEFRQEKNKNSFLVKESYNEQMFDTIRVWTEEYTDIDED